MCILLSSMLISLPLTDSSRNVFDFLMIQLDSRASRMSPNQALLTLHADYIGGEHANYRKWYFAAQLDLDDAIGASQNPGLSRVKSVTARNKKRKPLSASEKSLDSAVSRWRTAMNNMSQYDRLRQVALFLLCWGEAAQVRFTPECLCFIFKCADDYYRSPECQNRMEPVPEGLYLRSVVKPLYRFLRDQGYEVVEGKFLRRERDHHQIIGYDDVNQLFWYPEGIARIQLADKVSLVSRRLAILKLIVPLRTDSTGRHPSRSTVHEVRQDRLEQSLLQDLPREAKRFALVGQLQPYLGIAYLCFLVLHVSTVYISSEDAFLIRVGPWLVVLGMLRVCTLRGTRLSLPSRCSSP